MSPTLEKGDVVLINKARYSLKIPLTSYSFFTHNSPSRGDVIAFNSMDDPETENDESKLSLVKRVVGIEGDRVKMEGAHLYLNGQSQQEVFATWQHGGIHDFDELEIPDGKLFTLGDNRDLSKDSRFSNPPYINTSQVIGKVFFLTENLKDPDRDPNVIK